MMAERRNNALSKKSAYMHTYPLRHVILRSNDRNNENNSLKSARRVLTISDWRRVDTSTLTPTLLGEDGNCYEATEKAKVQKYGKKGKGSNATQKTCQEDGKGCVDNSSACHAFNGLFPCWNMVMMPCKIYERLS